MTSLKLRREIKKTIDQLPPQRLESLAQYVEFLARPTLIERIEKARKEAATGKAISWRKVRSDV